MKAAEKIAELLLKAKDIAKLQKKQIINKRGRVQTVYVGDNSKPQEKQQAHTDVTQTEAFKKWFYGSQVTDESKRAKKMHGLIDVSGEPIKFYHGGSADIQEFSKEKIGSGADSHRSSFGLGGRKPMGNLGNAFYFTQTKDRAQQFAEYRESNEIKINHVSFTGAEYEELLKQYKENVYGKFKDANMNNEIMPLWFDEPVRHQIVYFYVKAKRWIENNKDSSELSNAVSSLKDIIAKFESKMSISVPKLKVHEVYLSVKRPWVLSGQRDYDNFVARNAGIGDDPVPRFKEAGYDGIIYKNNEGIIEEVVVFEPTQIKATTAKEFDPESPNIYKSADRIADLLIKSAQQDYGQGRRQVLVDVHTQRGVYQRLQWVGTQAEQQQKPAVNTGRARADFNEALRNVADSLSFIEGITRIDTITQKTNYEATLADVKQNLDVIENSIKVMPDGSEKQSMIASRDRYLPRYKDRVEFYKSIFPTREAKEQFTNRMALSNIVIQARSRINDLIDIARSVSKLYSPNTNIVDKMRDTLGRIQEAVKTFTEANERLPRENRYEINFPEIDKAKIKLGMLEAQEAVYNNKATPEQKEIFMELFDEKIQEATDGYDLAKEQIDEIDTHSGDGANRAKYTVIDAIRYLESANELAKIAERSSIPSPENFAAMRDEMKQHLDEIANILGNKIESDDEAGDRSFGRTDAYSPEQIKQADKIYGQFISGRLKPDKYNYSMQAETYIKADLKKLGMTVDDAAHLAGAPPNSKVYISGDITVDEENNETSGTLEVHILNKQLGVEMKRRIDFDDKVIYNDLFTTDLRDKLYEANGGIGARILLDQLKAVNKTHGQNLFHQIVVVTAAGEGKKKSSSDWNGFYTWIRYGYNKKLNASERDSLRREVSYTDVGEYGLQQKDVEKFFAKDPLHYSDLMADKRWREWWKNHGYSLKDIYIATPDLEDAVGKDADETGRTFKAKLRFLSDYVSQSVRKKGITNKQTGEIIMKSQGKKGFTELFDDEQEQLLDKLAEKYGVYVNKQAEKPQMKSITSILKLAKSHDIVREIECCGLKICIENDTGDIRSGSDESGKNWTTVMRHPYGYIKGTMATDGDEMDCYVGPNQNADDVYVIIQTKPTGEFDENKVMIGFDSKHAAKTAFWNQYDCPEKYFGGIFEMSVNELKQALFDMRVTSLDEGILGSIRRKLMKSHATESHADFVKRITGGQKKSLKYFDLARKVKVIDDPLAKSERAERAKRLKDMADAIAARKKREC